VNGHVMVAPPIVSCTFSSSLTAGQPQVPPGGLDGIYY